MRKNRFLAATGVAVALAAGGIGAVALGGVSGAQTTDSTTTTTVPGSTDDSTTRPAPGTGRGDGENCPDKAGSGTSGSGTSGTQGSSTGSNISARGRGANFQRL